MYTRLLHLFFYTNLQKNKQKEQQQNPHKNSLTAAPLPHCKGMV